MANSDLERGPADLQKNPPVPQKTLPSRYYGVICPPALIVYVTSPEEWYAVAVKSVVFATDTERTISADVLNPYVEADRRVVFVV